MQQYNSDFDYKSAAEEVLAIEIAGLKQLSQHFDAHFVQACQTILSTTGKVVVMGMGKSGHIGKKIAATLASTGTSSFFVHPGEAAHGDLGMIDNNDVVLAISNSGESGEILGLFPVLKRQQVTIISMTGNPSSNMGKLADLHLCIKVPKEACPIELAPTASTTATLVMGDALAMALMRARGFSAEDFALSHPGGALGRKLLLKISDIMHSGTQLPKVTADAPLTEALLEMSEKGLGMTAIVDADNAVIGIFTDGDLRRLLSKRVDIHDTTIGEVMGPNPQVAHSNMLAVDGLNQMQERSISALLIVDDGQLVGALNMHDMLRAGVM